MRDLAPRNDLCHESSGFFPKNSFSPKIPPYLTQNLIPHTVPTEPMAIKLARPDYAISRIDQPGKKHHGWFVRVQIERSIQSKFFSDSLHGSRDLSLKAARKHRDSLLTQLSAERLIRLKGITHVVVKQAAEERAFWQVAWKDAQGRRRTKKFSVDDHGPRKSLKLAKEFLDSGCEPEKRVRKVAKKAAKRRTT
jgi:hypothetical protein